MPIIETAPSARQHPIIPEVSQPVDARALPDAIPSDVALARLEDEYQGMADAAFLIE